MNREEWLERLTDQLRPSFQTVGHALPDVVRVSVGFPSRRGLSAKNRVLGECWGAAAASDGICQIFMSPTLDDPLRVADVLVHELAHVVTPGAKHGPAFKRVAVALGLEGKMTATVASQDLVLRLTSLLHKSGLDSYPHTRLNAMAGAKKQGTRLLKVSCLACGYTCRITQKWIEIGFPTCPCGEPMEEIIG